MRHTAEQRLVGMARGVVNRHELGDAASSRKGLVVHSCVSVATRTGVHRATRVTVQPQVASNRETDASDGTVLVQEMPEKYRDFFGKCSDYLNARVRREAFSLTVMR